MTEGTAHPDATDIPPSYRGRFAPSPTGPLHFGSLTAALGSYLQARSRGGEWYVRMEDLDTPRTVAGAADSILRSLEAHGLYWDGPIMFQSSRNDAYHAALDTLAHTDLVFPCACSRREIADFGLMGIEGPVYPGTCRDGAAAPPDACAIRVRTTSAPVEVFDELQGPIRQRLEREVGDFVVRRADGLFSYQLAVVVDDAAQGITEVVRGSDLLNSTPRQVYLQQLLGLGTPGYIHLPIVADEAGRKLSKQTAAPALDDSLPVPALWEALAFLEQAPPPALRSASLPEFWEWAIANWDLERVPRQRTITARADLVR